MQRQHIWAFALFNLAVLIWVLGLLLIDNGWLPGDVAVFDMFGRYFVYETTALMAIMVNLFLAILALMTRPK